jgi:hypothetical protein
MCPPNSCGIVPLGNKRKEQSHTTVPLFTELFRMQTPPDLFGTPSIQAIQTQAAQINKF